MVSLSRSLVQYSQIHVPGPCILTAHALTRPDLTSSEEHLGRSINRLGDLSQPHGSAGVVGRRVTFARSLAAPNSASARAESLGAAVSLPPRSFPPASCTGTKNGCPAFRPAQSWLSSMFLFHSKLSSVLPSAPPATFFRVFAFARAAGIGEPAAEAGFVTRALENRWHRHDIGGQHALLGAAPAAVLV